MESFVQLTVKEYKELESYKLLLDKFGDKRSLETIINNYKEMLETKDVITVKFNHDYTHGTTIHSINLSESLQNTELYIKTKLNILLEVNSLQEQLKNQKEIYESLVKVIENLKDNWFNRLKFLFNKHYVRNPK